MKDIGIGNMFTVLMSYFLIGLSDLANVAGTFFSKDIITLPPSDLISVGIWSSLPWSIKLLFGSYIDKFELFGNHRKSYMILGNLLITLSSLIMVDSASSQILFKAVGQYYTLIISGLLGSIGTVVVRLVADALSTELPQTEELKAKAQLHTRMALIGGGLIGAVLSGYLATHLQTSLVFFISSLCPLINILLLLPITVNKGVKSENNTYIWLGLAFSVLVTALAVSLTDDLAQLSIFVISLVFIASLLFYKSKDLTSEAKKVLFISLLAIFLFRTTPGVGPSMRWFYIDKLGMDASYLGTLSVVSSVTTIASMFFLRNVVLKADTSKVLIWLTFLTTVLSLPDLMVIYNITFGMDPKTLVLVDSALVTGLSQLSMVPLGVIVANCVPNNNKVLYLALTSSLMNLALLASDLITKQLNVIYLVTRQDFTNLGPLTIASLFISTVLSLLGIGLLKLLIKKP